MTFHKKTILKAFSLLSISIAALTLTACGGGGGSDAGTGGSAASVTPLSVNLDAALAPDESGQISLQTSSDVSKVGVNYQPVNIAQVISSIKTLAGSDFTQHFTISNGNCGTELQAQGDECQLQITRNNIPNEGISTQSYTSTITINGVEQSMSIKYELIDTRFSIEGGNNLTVKPYINLEQANTPMYFALDNTTAQLALSLGSQSFCSLSNVSQSGNPIYKLVNNSQKDGLCTLVVTNAPNGTQMQAYWQYQNNTPVSAVVNGKFVINNNVLTQETN
ncbi:MULTISPECIES: hypothetical protein [Cysteiniphilum]|uniref:Lipoprotein n=1 Tax=Cysteiniphilum litorale TaxID=2056700 RepID=A0A8J2Z4M7_9GAMM|nr:MULTISPECIES: hypothetical protein [Cysteiniphilum]GGF97382.1 hypothetical protein GCM10010995_13210 [Cysteiniphilum litorale]